MSNTLQNVSGDPNYQLGDHGRRYELTFVCPADAECRLSVVSYDSETGEKYGRITYRWDDEAYVFAGSASYYSREGGSDCMSSDTLIVDAYRTHEDVRFIPAGRDGDDVVSLTGSKTITGTPTEAGTAAGCAPYELTYSAQMTFQEP